MRELIGRVAATDGDVATALRVIAHFDALVDRGASTPATLRAAAALAEAPAGMHDISTGRTTRVTVDGAALSGEAAGQGADWPRVAIDRAHASSVWLERDGHHRPLDGLILERCAHALRVRLGGAELLSTEDLVRTACDGDVTDAERFDALRALGLAIPLIVVASPAPAVPATRACALIDGTWVALQPTDHPAESLSGRTGTAVAVGGDIPRALILARRALALAVPPACGGPATVCYESLGPLATIAGAVGAEQAACDPDVVTLENLRAQRPWLPAVFSRMASGLPVREASRELHLHHSSLQDRVEWLEGQLGYSLRDAAGRSRAAAAWALWRVSGLLH